VEPVATTAFERGRPPTAEIREALASSRQSIFWLEDLPPAPRPVLQGSRRADLVVVGGGYAGLWTALMAKRRDPGLRVVLLEANTVGWAASGRNGGFCEASLTHGYENGLARWPEEIETLERLGMENLDGLEADLRAWGVDAEWERVGSLGVATEPHQLAWLEDARPGHVVLDEAAVRAAVASPTYLGGVWDRDGCALVHPGKLAAGLGRVAEEQGVEVLERSRVTSVDAESAPGARRVRVTTEGGEVRAERVVLATNAFPSLVRRNALMTVPVYDYVLLTEPLTGEQLASIGWRDRQGISDLANQFHYYRLTADNRILWGGYDAVYHFGGRMRAAYEDRTSTFEQIAGHFFATFPQLCGVRFSHRWAGAIDTSTRFCAFFGLTHGGRVVHAAGFTGLGVGATRFAADVMLDLLEGVTTERTSLRMVRERPLPFPPEPLAFAGIRATNWSMDRADHHQGRRNLWLRALDAMGMGFDS
jgi:glycine/D-amino acid oxidase-like deaminating enzyme